MAIDPEFSITAETLHRVMKTHVSYSQLAHIGSPDLSSILLRILDLATHYQSNIEYIQKDTQSFLRHIQSSRLHHSLSIRNVLIFQSLHALSDLIASYNKSYTSSTAHNSKQDGKDASIIRSAVLSSGPDCTLEDPTVASFWLRNWPQDVRSTPFCQQ